jgi:nickel-dependent lactate racemase
MSKCSFNIPFGKEKLVGKIDSLKFSGCYESGVGSFKTEQTEKEIVKSAFDSPFNSAPLEEIAAKAKNAVIIASDHTRPVPSKVIFPELLTRIRDANPEIDIKILIATGCHRGTTHDELIDKFGEDIVKNETIIIHDCRDEDSLIDLGKLPSGGEFRINRLAVETDLLISEGFIEPHFFAGFSGGRKSVLPGIAAEKTVMGNHCSEFIASPYARTGILQNNPLHRDMLFAAEKANLKFIINVVIDEDKKVIHAVAGDPVEAHAAGCNFLRKICGVKVPESEIVITSNGGYPLDQNIYQSVKGMSAAEAVCKEGGVIIMVSACSDGHGGESFYRQLAESSSPAELLKEIEAVPQDQTLVDQWEVQVLARILSKFKVIMVSSPEQEKTITDMHMQYAPTLEKAIEQAEKTCGTEAKFSVIPNGVAVIAEKKTC